MKSYNIFIENAEEFEISSIEINVAKYENEQVT